MEQVAGNLGIYYLSLCYKNGGIVANRRFLLDENQVLSIAGNYKRSEMIKALELLSEYDLASRKNGNEKLFPSLSFYDRADKSVDGSGLKTDLVDGWIPSGIEELVVKLNPAKDEIHWFNQNH